MKRIFIAIIVIIGFCGAGYQLLQYNNDAATLNQLRTQMEEVDTSLTTAKQSIAQLPISQYNTNTEMLTDLLKTDCIKLIQITAQARNAQGIYENILSVTSVEEVAYYTNTVSRIVMTASYDNFDDAFNYMANCTVPFSILQFDVKSKTVSVFMTPVTIGTSDVSSEFTDMPEAGAATEDSSAKTTEGIIPNGTESAGDFDIQYLGGDSDE